MLVITLVICRVHSKITLAYLASLVKAKFNLYFALFWYNYGWKPGNRPVPNGTGENVNAEASRSANWKIYTGSKFLIQYPSNLVITPSGLIEVIESVQFGEKDKEETNYIRVSASSGGETTFKNRKETYLTYGIYNPKQEELFVGGLNAWRYSGTDADGSNFRQHVLFYKDDLGFEIDNFGINKNIFDQILSTFKFIN